MADKKKKLTVKQQRFVEELANPKTKSATQAAIKAGYSPKIARRVGSLNMTKNDIVERLEERKRKAAKHAKVTPEQVMGEYAAIAFSSVEDAHDDEGVFDYQKAVENGTAGNIKKINRAPTGEITSVDFHSKTEALGKIGNYLGVEKFSAPETPSIEELAKELFAYLLSKLQITEIEARDAVIGEFPDAIDIKLIETEKTDK